MTGLSSLGIGSNLELGKLLDQLRTQEQKRLTPLTQQQTSFKGKLTAFGVLKSGLEKLKTASVALKKADTISNTGVSGTNNVFAATTDSTANPGSYSIEVKTLAQAQCLLSASSISPRDLLGTTGVGSRTVTITQPGQSNPLIITLSDDQTSLLGIRDAINQQQGSVNATIINANDNEHYLSLTAKDTGTQAVMTIEVSGDRALSDVLAYDPTMPSRNKMTQQVSAQNAEITLNGVTVTRQHNTVTDVLQGVTLTLKALTAPGQPEPLHIIRDSAPMQEAIEEWVNAYNSLQTTFSSLTRYTAVEGGEKQSADNGALLGDSTLRIIQTQLRSQLALVQTHSDLSLDNLGIKQESNGTLAVNIGTLRKALNNQPGCVSAFFIGDGKTTGFATQADTLLNTALDETKGTLRNATDTINNRLKNLDQQVIRTTNNISAAVERYKAQFIQLDKLVSSLNQTSDYLTQKLKQ